MDDQRGESVRIEYEVPVDRFNMADGIHLAGQLIGDAISTLRLYAYGDEVVLQNLVHGMTEEMLDMLSQANPPLASEYYLSDNEEGKEEAVNKHVEASRERIATLLDRYNTKKGRHGSPH